MTLHTVMHVLTLPEPLPSNTRNLLVRQLRNSHRVFEPMVDAQGRRVGIQVKVGGVTPFDAIGPATSALALAMKDSGWVPQIGLLELTIEPAEALTQMRRSP